MQFWSSYFSARVRVLSWLISAQCSDSVNHGSARNSAQIGSARGSAITSRLGLAKKLAWPGARLGSAWLKPQGSANLDSARLGLARSGTGSRLGSSRIRNRPGVCCWG